ncbi:ABC transporter substrate-binding protein [Salinactinospora qingdaonensis]|uniref:ABC-type branched-chain amino acid transport system, substrate-binding protein n=1 Tax=Salinactinospora qingdaonensis TaxID=702744 RepID=A0ABP7GBF4_9ACTN
MPNIETTGQDGHHLDQQQARIAGMKELRGAFTSLRWRPSYRKGDKPLPTLNLTGPPSVTAEVLTEFDRSCGNDPRARLPLADSDAPVDVPSLVREAAQRLSTHSHWFEPALRFPRLDRVLWLLEQQKPPGTDRKAQRRHIYRRFLAPKSRTSFTRAGRGLRNFLLELMDLIVTPIIPVLSLISITASSVLDMAFSLIMLGGIALLIGIQGLSMTMSRLLALRFRWFLEQPYMCLSEEASRKFSEFALGVIENRHSEQHRDEIDKLVVNAFLQDLSRAYVRTLLRRAPWARTNYPVLLLQDVTPGSPGQRLLDLITAVRQDTRKNVDRLDPLLLVVSSTEPIAAPAATPQPAPPPARPHPQPPSLWSVLLGRRSRPRPAAPAPQHVTVSAGTSSGVAVSPQEIDEALEEWRSERESYSLFGPPRMLIVGLQSGDDSLMRAGDGPIQRPRRRPIIAHPLLAVGLVLAFLAASGGVAAYQVTTFCGTTDIRRIEGQCIGISDGSHVFDPVLGPVFGQIEAQNAAVDTEGDDYVTVIYIGAMSTAGDAGENALLAGVHGELLGIATQQMQANQVGAPRIRVLMANSGADFEHGERVAEEIVAYARQDSSVMAVIGFGQSTRGAQDAVRTINGIGLPMIGTTTTSRDVAQISYAKYSRFFYPMAPYNEAIAEQAANWAKEGVPSEAEEDEQLFPAVGDVDVFYHESEDDLYSEDLGQNFHDFFGPHQAEMFSYDSQGKGISQGVQQACEDPPDLVYYAGRSDHVDQLMDEFENSRCTSVTLLAGDDVTQYVAQRYAEGDTTAQRIQFYYTPLAFEKVWDSQGSEDPIDVTNFYEDYYKLRETLGVHQIGDQVDQLPSPSHAAMAGDAVDLVRWAAKLATEEQSSLTAEQPNSLPRDISFALSKRQGHEGVAFNGTTGAILFGPRGSAHKTQDRVIPLVQAFPLNEQQLIARCGKLVADGVQPENCERSRRPISDFPGADISAQ